MQRIVERIARAMAVLGGIVLTALILLVCASVLGRALNTLLHGWVGDLAPGLAEALLSTGIGPVNGDFELVEAGVAFSIFAFLPLCQVSAGHASVDIFTQMLGETFNRALKAVIEVIFAGALILIAVQLHDGMQAKMRYGETTFLLQFPVWWAYAASLFGAVVAALVGIWMAFVRVAELVTGRVIAPEGAGADH